MKSLSSYRCGSCGAVYQVEHQKGDGIVAVVCWDCDTDSLCEVIDDGC